MKHVAVFARWPEPGRVKTRLSPALPPELACALHRAMLLDAIAAVAGAPADARHLYWADPPPEPGASDLAPQGWRVRTQRGADLGERLDAAFHELLAAAGRAMIVGTDCPELGARRLGDALARLETADLVLGPTRDGGYYLVGLGRPAPELFRDVPWGSDRVLEVTRARAQAAGLATTLLEPLEDVDTPADLIGLVTRCLARPDAAPRHTSEALASIGILPAFG